MLGHAEDQPDAARFFLTLDPDIGEPARGHESLDRAGKPGLVEGLPDGESGQIFRLGRREPDETLESHTCDRPPRSARSPHRPTQTRRRRSSGRQ